MWFRALAPAALVLGLLAALPASAEPPTPHTYSGTDSAYLTPRAGAEQSGPSVRLGYVKVPAPGTYYAELDATVKNQSVDAVQLVSLSLVCKEESSVADQIGTRSNIVRGETLPMSTRVYFTIKDKRGACFAYGTTMGLKSSSKPLTSRRLLARVTLTISGPVSDRTVESRRFDFDDANRGFSGRSFLAKPKQQAHASELVTSAAPGSQAFVTGNAYLTTCTFRGGSRDQTTDGRDLCPRSVDAPNGSLVRERLLVRQYTPGGSVCATTVVPGSTKQFRITARRHHLGTAVEGTISLSAKQGCGNRIKVWTEVQVLSGPSVVVHFPATTTGFRPL
ncbi:hypothetical protein K8Z61_15480 [Nocardioides sp. TRM66260-LWL]|uniref:hypothetical protein n=1 Tax=Nocardioides sp. TRM66260-LWL TaxID=2874478 RepID=UPI001CC6B83F|nr:hypothetical protein [Nocardioides sp. TRM66260-LWL]MBZ5735895.1 hypothetical protein [Nocardioides sp. TRM66260-LWL]